MALSVESLFLRFRRDGSPSALAGVFDETATELLRVACHVASDLGAAEDLVQSTFLTAIESAKSWDERRPLLPWLLGILANHARAARRAGAREGERAVARAHELRLLPRVEPSALHGAQAREAEALVQRELDRLAEPYREVAILALRHQLEPREIAAALGRSPGAVRVQLHRALEQLRQKVPRGAVLPALLFASPAAGELGRGLAVVREVVLSSASKAAAAAALVTVGSLVVTKKVVAAAVLVTAAATVVWKSWPASETTSDSTPAASARESANGVDAPTDASAAPKPVAASNAESAVPKREKEGESGAPSKPTPAVPTVALEGIVLDGMTQAPIRGARLSFHEPLRMRLSEVRRRFASFASTNPGNGIPHFVSGWPQLVEPLPEGAWRDAVDVEVCAPPQPPSTPFAAAATDGEGRFRFDAVPARGLLRVEHEGFESQTIALVESAPELRIELFAAHLVKGYVTDPKGSRIPQSVQLLFHGIARNQEEQRARSMLGPWLVTTRDDGTFEFQGGAPVFGAICMTAGFEAGMTWHQKTPDDPLRVDLQRRPVLTVVDAATKQPIEDFSMLVTSLNLGSPVHAGRFHAPAGRLQLEAASRRSPNAGYPAQEAGFADLWGEHHAPARVEIPRAEERVDLTVELSAGEPLELSGKLLRAGAPIANRTISLEAFYPLGWSERSLSRIDETATSDDGSFTLHGPPGRFVLFVKVDEKPLMRVVELPASAPFVLDVASGGRIDVIVRDAKGTPRPDAKVAINGPNQKSELAITDADGRARFDTLVAGQYQIGLHGTRETHVAIPQDEKSVQVSEGAVATAELTAPPAGPIHLRIDAEGTSDYTGWRARDGTYVSTAWDELKPDGTLDQDAVNFTYFKVAAPDGRTWTTKLTPQILADGVVELRVNDVGYRGRLFDRTTNAPLAGAEVRASLPDGEESVSAVADADGRFELCNLAPVVCSLSVRRKSSTPPGRGGRRNEDDEVDAPAWFTPAQPAAPGGRELLLRVPQVRGDTMVGAARCVVTGRLLRRSDDRPVANAVIFLYSKFQDDDGAWTVTIEGSIARSGADGRYSVAAPRAPTWSLSVYDESEQRSHRIADETWADDGGESTTIERDIRTE
jgi:RNA polymerase sigma factor (sigma-70 family)